MNIFITGANRGLGFELLLEALQRGHHIYAALRNEHAMEQLSELIQQHKLDSSAITVLQCDVKNEAEIAKVALTLKQNEVKLHSIINSAAILVGRETAIEDVDMDDLLNSFDVNLFGPMRIIKHLIPLLAKQESSIINISSEAGSITNAYAGDYPYSLSKCALNLFSEQLKRWLSAHDTNVWSIHPGWMRTEMGGPAAPLSPDQSAQGILDIIERKVTIESKFAFINYKGEAMDI